MALRESLARHAGSVHWCLRGGRSDQACEIQETSLVKVSYITH